MDDARQIKFPLGIESKQDLLYTEYGKTLSHLYGKAVVINIHRRMEIPMNEETLNLSIRKFLKMVGINSQREIERAVAKAIEDGLIDGSESFPARATVEVAGLNLSVNIDGEIRLQ